jgi:glycine/D-amino acid oxidase-like deaminating enzyme
VRGAHPALADAAPRSFWLDSPDAPPATPPLAADTMCDLAVVGGGYTGLWTAVLAKEADPGRDVVLLESRTVGWAASGRNGGFCSSSLTHGIGNGHDRFPDELAQLERLGRENLDAIEASIATYGIDCDFERTGAIEVATAPHQVQPLRADVEMAQALGEDCEFLDESAVRAQIDSPTYLAGAWHRGTTALVDPARLAWGLRAACVKLGVRVVEHTRVVGLSRTENGVAVRTEPGGTVRTEPGGTVRTEPGGTVRAACVALATNAFPSPLRRVRHYVVPVYDYALMSEPLTSEQLDAIGWRNRQGVSDLANQFH